MSVVASGGESSGYRDCGVAFGQMFDCHIVLISRYNLAMTLLLRFRQSCIAAAVLLLCLWTAPTLGQPDGLTSQRFEARIVELFANQQYQQAADLLEAQLKKTPTDQTVLYNAACAYSRLGKLDRAAELLFQSVEAGFLNFDHIINDPDLENLREHPGYLEIIAIRDEAYEAVAKRQLDAARRQFGEEGYRYETDNDRRLNYVTALDDTAHGEMREMLELQADHLSKLLFEKPPNYFTMIVVPTPTDARRIIRDATIGGVYEHAKRRLVALDIGLMLRHEFVHLMHYGHMERLAQPHELWVQEGLACLYETYYASPNGGIRILPNQRHNLVKNLIANKAQPRWRELFQYDADRFMRDARDTYPMVRSIFRFLDDQKKLDDWYQMYIETFEEDKSGILAFERVFESRLEEVERRWRMWVRAQPMIDDLVVRGDASLGVQYVEEGSNDGVLLEAVRSKSAAEEAGIKPGDVIVAVDGQPTRSHFELLTIIGNHRVGDQVEVRVRRGTEYITFDVRLKPLR